MSLEKNASNLEYNVQNNMIVQRYLDLSVFSSSNSKNRCKSIYSPHFHILCIYIVYSRCVCSKGALRHDSMPTLCGYSVFPVTENVFLFSKKQKQPLSVFLSDQTNNHNYTSIHKLCNKMFFQ